MRLLKIKLDDFKGFTGHRSGREFCFGQRTLVNGHNGVGKSTLMDAHLWLFADKDSRLKSNPDIRPDDEHDCIPKVEEEWEINGTIVTISKMQKKTMGKPDSRGISKITLSNKYEINGVPKTERDFKKDLTERGFNFDNFLALSHIDVFTSGKADDMRKTLFRMAYSKTDEEIASDLDGCADVYILLKSYKAEEIEAMNKASKKKAEEQIQGIPNQIIGMEKAKVNIDTAELELQRADIKRQISDIEGQISDSRARVRVYDTITEKILGLKKRKELIEIEANCENETKRTDLDFEIKELKHKKRLLSDGLKNAELDLQQAEIAIQRHTVALENARNDYLEQSNQEFNESKLHAIESEQFDESELICPTCGQDLPVSKQQEIREKFLESKQKRIAAQEEAREAFDKSLELRLESITIFGNKAKQDLRNAEKSKFDSEKKIEQYKNDICSVEKKLSHLEEDLESLPQFVELSGNQEYQTIRKQISDKETELKSMDNGSEYRKSKEDELKKKFQELSEVESEIAKAENDVRIDEQIFELQKKQHEYGQKKADADNILYQLSLVSKTKNTLLEKEINSHFDGVRFKLFDYQKNGEYKEVCILEILDENGEWKSIDKTANTALEIEGKMAVVDGLQRFYGVGYPVFVDSAERLDEYTIERIKTDFQVIFLKVGQCDLNVCVVE